MKHSEIILLDAVLDETLPNQREALLNAARQFGGSKN